MASFLFTTFFLIIFSILAVITIVSYILFWIYLRSQNPKIFKRYSFVFSIKPISWRQYSQFFQYFFFDDSENKNKALLFKKISRTMLLICILTLILFLLLFSSI